MRGISKSFGGTRALDGVDFDVSAGEIHALVGENGAGKSTLMKILSGALRPDAGAMLLDGLAFIAHSTHDARRAGISMIYQELSLAPHLSVAENIVLGMEPNRAGILRRKEIAERAGKALTDLGHEDIPLTIRLGSLPPAKRQVVEIARALATGCRVLVLDEPTSSLSLEDVARLFDVLRRLVRGGTSVIYISHFLEEVKEISDRFTVLRDGRRAGGGVSSTTAVEELVGLMVGRRITELYPHSSRNTGEPLLVVENLAGMQKPNAASIVLHRGEVLGIAGLIGSGRTEFLRAIFGLDPVRRGSIRIGSVSGYASPAARWKSGVGFVSEDRAGEGLALSMSIADNITMNLSRDAGRFGFLRPARIRKRAEELIQLLAIRSTGASQPVGSLSGGNQQKVALARLLHEDVDVILLDEPTRGIDVASKSHMYSLIDRLATGDAERGIKPKGVLMVSSYLPELLGICDRIAVMTRGVLGPPHAASAVDQHSLMVEATGQGSGT